MTIDEVLYEHSYCNLVLYAAATPQYDDENEEKDNGWDESKDLCKQRMKGVEYIR